MKSSVFVLTVSLLLVWIDLMLVMGRKTKTSSQQLDNYPESSSKIRIIGGVVASASDFPWTVYIKRIGGRGITCTGELISKRWIVTAAHCLLNDNDSGYRSPYPLGNTQVTLGCSDLSQGTCRTYTVKTHVAHPCYTPSVDQDHDDIAMLELVDDAHISFADMALVDGINGTAPTAVGSSVTLAGYGTVSNTNLVHSQFLMRVDVGIVSQGACEQQNPYSLHMHYIDFQHVICTGGTAGKDSCLGDSGGPAIARDSSGRTWLVGVLSKGSELPSYTDWCAVEGRYGMYTRIRHYADFVLTTMQGGSYSCSRCPCVVEPPAEGLGFGAWAALDPGATPAKSTSANATKSKPNIVSAARSLHPGGVLAGLALACCLGLLGRTAA
uniref:Peptidase S1 domain-containing protein n=1 Tax=Cryptomonas curvata TaxID=233186 RepID=A0A7S0QEA8_9CRYP|mmetsp:Transcript_16977/g.35892  ORF Transcript_16977/g.35892 Transcript_16977/m.35892 type:complete len:382 (+) Transcript_16977:102-1247(+)